MFGHVPDYPPGTLFESRRELYDAGVHRHLQAGIVGGEQKGAESIILSGGYEDDEDFGDAILYTGEGGRDSKTKQQVVHQQLSGRNLALVTSMKEGLPIRVIRGAHPEIHKAPTSGYRYDGLYRVEDWWAVRGQAGFRVYRFRLVPIESTQPNRVVEKRGRYDPAPRRDERVQRIVRSTAVAEQVKRLHKYRCQLCGEQLETPGGPYAEAAHIRPLGRPHDGPDVSENVLCLCPNHHVLFDQFGIAIRDDFELIGFPGRLRTHPRHRIGVEHLRYHRRLFEAAE